MRLSQSERKGKLLNSVEAEGKTYQIREFRKYKDQGKGKRKLIVGTDLRLCDSKKNLIKGGFKNKESIYKYIVEEILKVKDYNLVTK